MTLDNLFHNNARERIIGKNPCGKCERKGCGAYHSQCEAYIEWSRKNNEQRNAEHIEKEKNRLRREFRIDMIEKVRKGGGRK